MSNSYTIYAKLPQTSSFIRRPHGGGEALDPVENLFLPKLSLSFRLGLLTISPGTGGEGVAGAALGRGLLPLGSGIRGLPSDLALGSGTLILGVPLGAGLRLPPSWFEGAGDAEGVAFGTSVGAGEGDGRALGPHKP